MHTWNLVIEDLSTNLELISRRHLHGEMEMKKLVSALLMTLIILSTLLVLTSQVKVWATAVPGEALSFDGGSNYVSVSPIDANTYTFELWFNSETNNALIGSNRFLIQTGDQFLIIWHDVYVGPSQWYPVSIGTGNWHLLDVIIDYTTWQITPYLDGTNLGTKSTTTNTKQPIT